MAISSEFSKSYNSFAGPDIRAVFGDKVIGTLQGISWSVSREKAPVYVLGDPDPKAFARGKRGIAGSLVFIQFDRHALLSELETQKFWADKDALRPDGTSPNIKSVEGPRTAASTVFSQDGIAAQENSFGDATNPRNDQSKQNPWFSDQIPPFDITLTASNEYGAAAVMRIYGVEILNEGAGVSIDDIVLEQQMTFVARTIAPWVSHGYDNPNGN